MRVELFGCRDAAHSGQCVLVADENEGALGAGAGDVEPPDVLQPYPEPVAFALFPASRAAEADQDKVTFLPLEPVDGVDVPEPQHLEAAYRGAPSRSRIKRACAL